MFYRVRVTRSPKALRFVCAYKYSKKWMLCIWVKCQGAWESRRICPNICFHPWKNRRDWKPDVVITFGASQPDHKQDNNLTSLDILLASSAPCDWTNCISSLRIRSASLDSSRPRLREVWWRDISRHDSFLLSVSLRASTALPGQFFEGSASVSPRVSAAPLGFTLPPGADLRTAVISLKWTDPPSHLLQMPPDQ